MHGFIRWARTVRLFRISHLFALLIGLGVGGYFWAQYPQPRLTTQINDAAHGVQWVSGYTMHFTPDGGRLLTIPHDSLLIQKDGGTSYYSKAQYAIQICDVRSGELTVPFQDRISSLAAFSCDGLSVATLSTDEQARKHTFKVRDLTTGQETASFIWPVKLTEIPAILQLGFAAKGELVALDAQYRVWDVAQEKILASLVPLDNNSNPPVNLPNRPWRRSAPDTPEYVALWHKGVVKAWHWPTATLTLEIADFGAWNETYWCRPALSPDGRTLGWQDAEDNQPSSASMAVMNLASGARHPIPQRERVWSCAISPDGKTLAVYFIPKRLQENFFDEPEGIWKYLPGWFPGYPHLPKATTQLYDVASGSSVATLKNCSWPIFSPDGKTLAGQMGDSGLLQIWDLPIQRPLAKIIGYGLLSTVASLLAFRGLMCLWQLKRGN